MYVCMYEQHNDDHDARHALEAPFWPAMRSRLVEDPRGTVPSKNCVFSVAACACGFCVGCNVDGPSYTRPIAKPGARVPVLELANEELHTRPSETAHKRGTAHEALGNSTAHEAYSPRRSSSPASAPTARTWRNCKGCWDRRNWRGSTTTTITTTTGTTTTRTSTTDRPCWWRNERGR